MANEVRLIDANALQFRYAKMLYPDGTASNGYHAFVTSVEVKDAPTVDAVEVVHGRWEVQSDGYSDGYWKCSACGEEWFFSEDPATEYARVNYCPNCGADMRGDGNA